MKLSILLAIADSVVCSSSSQRSICETSGSSSKVQKVDKRSSYDIGINYQSPDEIDQLLKNHPVLDGHNDLPYLLRLDLQNTITDGRYNYLQNLAKNASDWQSGFVMTDYPRSIEGYHLGQLWSVFVECGSQYKDAVRQTLEQIDLVKRLANEYPDIMSYCSTSDCVRKAWSEGKFASLTGMEGGHSIDNSIAMIRIYAQLGVRYMTLTHNCNTPWSDNNLQDDPNSETPDKLFGITDFGRDILKEMNRYGMVIDLSHVTEQVMKQALSVSEAPVMMSHSNAKGVYNHPRNVPDDVLWMLKNNDGVIMLNAFTDFVADTDSDGTI